MAQHTLQIGTALINRETGIIRKSTGIIRVVAGIIRGGTVVVKRRYQNH
jgi:hypothetical protein